MIKEVDVDGDGRIDFYGKSYLIIKKMSLKYMSIDLQHTICYISARYTKVFFSNFDLLIVIKRQAKQYTKF